MRRQKPNILHLSGHRILVEIEIVGYLLHLELILVNHVNYYKFDYVCSGKIFCHLSYKKYNTIISSDNYQLYICSVTAAAAIFLSINGVATFKAMHFLFKDTLWYKMCITWSFFLQYFCPSLSHNSLRPKPGFGIGNRNQYHISVLVLVPKLDFF